MEGIVIKSTGSWYSILASDKKMYECRIKGKFRMQDIKNTNPVSVGDEVKIELDQEEGKGIIYEIKPRRNYIIRKSTNLSKQYHIIASNVDQLLLVVTLVAPETPTAFIDRYLITAEAYEIPPILVFNKVDLYKGELLEYLDYLENVYKKIGYQTLRTSVKNKTGISELKNILKDKKTLISGNSGVGKSSLVNCVEPDLDIKTASISLSSFKGKHTTTFAEMHPLSFGGFIIDTPGIKSFAMADMKKEEISHYFPEIFEISKTCKFHNCKHINEPGCQVLAALEKGDIIDFRYKNYLSIMEDDDESKYRA